MSHHHQHHNNHRDHQISLSFAFPRAGQSPSAGHLAAGKSAAGQASRAGGAR